MEYDQLIELFFLIPKMYIKLTFSLAVLKIMEL